MSCDKLESVVSRLEAVAGRLESMAVKGGSSDGECIFLEPLKNVISAHVTKFVDASSAIGPDVCDASKLVLKAFQLTVDLMKVVSVSKKPSNDKLTQVLKPLSTCIEEIKGFVGKNFKSQFKNHLEAIAAFSVSFAWVQAPNKPHLFINENIEAGMFYGNRVLTGFKDKGPEHKTWVSGLKKCFEELSQYVQDYHATGCSWNPKGGEADSAPAAAATTVPKSEPQKPASTPAQKCDVKSLFSDLNKGTGITTGLRKVDDSEKTHKNPNLRAGAVVTESEKPKPTTTRAVASQPAVQKEPVMEQEGKKWMIEYQKDKEMLEVSEGDIGYTVYIHKCVNTNIKINNKMNIVTLDNCVNCKVQLVCGLISSIEVTNCKKAEVHADDVLPFVNINSTDGCQVYLNDKSKGAKVSTSVSSSVNVCHWSPTTDLVEHAVPTLFVSYFKDNKLVTEISECI